MTQTPASGPFALLTTPPMSSLSIWTVPAFWSAPTPAIDEARNTAMQIPGYKTFLSIRSPVAIARTP